MLTALSFLETVYGVTVSPTPPSTTAPVNSLQRS